MTLSSPTLRAGAVLALALSSLAVLGASPAHAGSSSVAVVSGKLTVTSAAGGNDALVLADATNGGGTPVVRVTEASLTASSLTLGPGCVQTAPRVIECPKASVTGYVVNTGNGNDSLSAAALNLTGVFNGGDGADIFVPGAASETFNGGPGVDHVNYSGRSLAVRVALDGVANDGGGREGDDIEVDVERATGGAGSDLLIGSVLANSLFGGPGNDSLTGGPGGDVLSGGPGVDVASYADRSASVTVTLDNVANDGTGREIDNVGTDVENLIGSGGSDKLTGSSADNVIDGGGGADMIVGGRGIDTASYASRAVPVNVSKDGVANDGASGEGDNVAADMEVLVGGSAGDKLVGSAGNDTFDGGRGADDVTGLGGTDTMTYAGRVAAVTVTLNNQVGDGEAGENDNVRTDVENLIGGSAGDSFLGSVPANLFEGRGGNDIMAGAGGNDMLDGGTGADTLGGGVGIDTVTYAGRAAPVTANLDGFTNDGEAGEGDTIQSDVENLTGGSGNDVLTGNTAANVLDGGPGADVMSGGSGSDTVTYAARTAAVTADSDGVADDGVSGEKDNIGTDVENLTGGSGGDTLQGNLGPAILVGGSGADLLIGTSQADQLSGGGGDDHLEGRTGTDLFDGGTGTDVVGYSSAGGPVVADLDGIADDGVAGENENLGVTIEGITGGPFQDTLTGNDGPNTLDGLPVIGGAKDFLRGLGGNDVLLYGGDCRGSFGDDKTTFCTVAYGDAGNDVLHGGRVYGGDGNDDLKAFQLASGGAGADTLTSDDEPAAVLDGGTGGDTFKGPGRVQYGGRVNPVAATPDGVANDGEVGELDNILPGGLTAYFELAIIGGAGNDKLTGNVVLGGAGNDVINGGPFLDRLDGGSGNDTISGKAHNDVILPGSGNDIVFGDAGYDIVYASDGADVMDGGLGEIDQYVATYLPGPVKISLNGLADDGRAGELDNVKGFEVVWGTSANDQLAGSARADELYGLGGNDTLAGGDHSDTLFGGLGADTFSGGNGTDRCDFDVANDLLALSCETAAISPKTVPPPP